MHVNANLIISSSLRGGAYYAAKAHSKYRNLEFYEMNVSIYSFFLDKIGMLFNFLFRIQGEDLIYPFFLFKKKRVSKLNFHEMHWVLSGDISKEFLSTTNKSKPSFNLTIYCHDEWWTNGWNCYSSNQNDLEFYPNILRSIRLSLRSILKAYCLSELKKYISYKSIEFKSPSKWLAKKFIDINVRCIYDEKQFHIIYNDIKNHYLTLKKNENRSILLLYTPKSNWYRKGSDLSIDKMKALIKQGTSKYQQIIQIGDYQYCDLSTKVYTNVKREFLLNLLSKTQTLVFLPRRDNLPNIIIEALAAGVPEIISNENHGVEIPF